ncbi:MAG TPA: DUF5666 domain-containing protein [Sedimentisphaerales bacterium]|jgi:hypothetical protein|nr:DUF5666 domain-containing protein [Sedimentisphaerales bacterium]
MKKVWIMTLAFVLVSSVLVTAAGQKGGPNRTRIEGVITDIDSASQQLSVAGVTVQVTPSTVITMKDELLSFDDLSVGMTVVVCGMTDEDDILWAHSINVKYCGK